MPVVHTVLNVSLRSYESKQVMQGNRQHEVYNMFKVSCCSKSYKQDDIPQEICKYTKYCINLGRRQGGGGGMFHPFMPPIFYVVVSCCV